MSEPRPALKYTLLPEVIDQIPGNAALAYQRALQLHFQNEKWNDHVIQCRKWIDLPLRDFPVEEAAEMVKQYRSALEELKRASHYERCDWQIPVRQEGINAILPHLAGTRDMARLLATDIRRRTARGHYESAIEQIRVGFTLAGHIGNGDTLIEGLVGIAIAKLMLARVEELIQQPNAPSLYWALTDVPPAFISSWRATRWERIFIYANLPALREVERRSLTVVDLRQMVADISPLTRGILRKLCSDQDRIALVTAAAGLTIYPQAKRFLSDQGRSTADLAAMPVAEVIIRYIRDSYEIRRDNIFKWFALPYPEALAGLTQAETELQEAIQRDPIGNILASMLLPALSKASFRFAELDREIALLRCVEAIRIHAAAQNETLPATLDTVVEVPVPKDPMTGQSFPYRVEGNRAYLEARPVPGKKSKTGRIYEIMFRK